MLKIKKILSVTLATLMIASMSIGVFAADSTNSLYIETTKVPEYVTEYVVDDGGRLVASLCEELSLSYNDMSIGTPFEVLGRDDIGVDLYMYPVLYADSFEYILYVYIESDGNIVPSISDLLVPELKQYSNVSSPENPLMLFASNNNLYVTSNKGTSLLYQYSNQTQAKSVILPIAEFESNKVVDALTESNIDMVEPSMSPTTIAANPPSYSYISLSRTEQQGSQEWCSAFAGAAIIRTLNSDSTTALDIMTSIVGSNPSNSDTISHSELIDYAEGVGLSPTKKSGTLATSSVRTYIVDDNPIYLSCYGGGTASSKSRHALVLRGYSDNYDTYSIWNPWDEDSYYSMDMSDKTHNYPGGASWTWDDTIYSW